MILSNRDGSNAIYDFLRLCEGLELMTEKELLIMYYSKDWDE